MTIGAIGWFEIGTARPDDAQAFYGGLFGWQFERNESLSGFDVAKTCERAADLGGRVDLGPITLETGLACAYLSDPEGNRFAVFTPPPH